MPVNDTTTPNTPEACLPTLSKLGNPLVPEDLEAPQIASEWLSSFSKFAEKENIDGVLSQLVDSSFESGIFDPQSDSSKPLPSGVSVYWRDCLALTWAFRTFEGTPKIRKFLSDRLQVTKMSNLQLKKDVPATLQRIGPDLVWIAFMFTFETAFGSCTAVARLVPIRSGPDGESTVWKAHTIFTNLEDLKGFDEKIGPRRNPKPNHGKWEDEREKEVLFEDKDPTVLIIGGGHGGMTVAARLKALDVTSLIIEKNERIGDNWRARYDALCLHDPVCELFILVVNHLLERECF